MRQFFIDKCNSFIVKCDSYYKMSQLLQNTTFIKKYMQTTDNCEAKLGQKTVGHQFNLKIARTQEINKI